MKKGRKEGFLHSAISSKITLAIEKERKNRKTEEEETDFLKRKKQWVLSYLTTFKKICLAEEVYLQFGGNVFKKLHRNF